MQRSVFIRDVINLTDIFIDVELRSSTQYFTAVVQIWSIRWYLSMTTEDVVSVALSKELRSRVLAQRLCCLLRLILD